MNVFPVCDAHLHLSALPLSCLEYMPFPCKICTCALSIEEFSEQKKRAETVRKKGVTVLCALGIHPLHLDSLSVSALHNVLCTEEKSAVEAIGEIGLDFFTPELRAKEKEQLSLFALQLELAEQYSLPAVIHLRKALGALFSHKDILQKLKKCPSVVFHGFEGSRNDAEALLKRGVNAYFGIGKTILKGDKSAMDCVKRLEKSRLLFETDAPYQTLRGESVSAPRDVVAVVARSSEIADFDFAQDACAVFDRAFFPKRCASPIIVQ